jgi:ABC-type oligopeptide transport system substrate-binding subunit
MIAAMVAANTHEEFNDAVRAYDRVLVSGFYIVPLFYTREYGSPIPTSSHIRSTFRCSG